MTCSPCCLALVSITLLSPGLALPPCNVTMALRDLGCLLQWECSALSPNTTFTVQAKMQGDADWKEVDGCVRVTSRSCDVSRMLLEFELYHYIRLGQDGTAEWIQLPRFQPSTKTVYSRPTLSVSVKGTNLNVAVQFPCSPIKDCPPRKCCPLSQLMLPQTDITVYNELRPSERQTRTVCAEEETVRHEFWGLVPGERYCAVANFTLSPPSSPQCVSLPPQTEVQETLWLVGGMLLFALVPVFCFVRQQWQSAETHLPRSLAWLQEWVPTEPAVRRGGSQEDCEGDRLSILSLPLSEHSYMLTPPPDAQADSQSQGDGYCSNPFPMDSGSGQLDWDSGGMGSGLPTPDYGPSSISLPLGCIVAPCLSQEDTHSPPQMHRRSAVMEPFPLGPPPPLGVAPDIPLISVRLGECEGEELEDLGWCHLTSGHSEDPRSDEHSTAGSDVLPYPAMETRL
ncbi:hypothetical protein MATL_G00196850 [Megalops atlanticus]|uniref:Fibronectin type-III domain-containing protein n=1 Tax=Megalops atlanticus TaxID=7932 RepID=A0A9D3PNL1_MEGAT|nr:hypothetical protein MATL_G00196850 [Megalops atlanticus]